MTMDGSKVVMEVLETFLETHPKIAYDNRHLKIGERKEGENASVQMVEIEMGDEVFLVVAKRIGDIR